MRPQRSASCLTIIFFVLIVWLLVPSNAASQEMSSERERVVETIHASIGWAKNKDFRLLYSVIANDSNYVEVSPGKRVVRGFEQFKSGEKFWGSPDFKALRYEVRDLIIHFSRSRDVAWFYGVLDDVNEWKGKPASWMNTRWTGVLEKSDGRWIIVQMHFSFPSD